MLKNQKGITLIALVITIIVLLILAGITIALIAGQDSAPQKAVEGRAKDALGAAKDAVNMQAAANLEIYYEKQYVNPNVTLPTGTTAADFASKPLAAYAARSAGAVSDVTVDTTSTAPTDSADGSIVLKYKDGTTATGTVDKTSGVITWGW